MAGTVGAILEFLHRHNFSVAETALRSELTARQNVNSPLSLALDEEFELSFPNCLQPINDRDPREQGAYSPRGTSPERSKAAQQGFSFVQGQTEGQGFRERSFAVPDADVCVDSHVDNAESPKSQKAPRPLKSAFSVVAAVETEKGELPVEGEAMGILPSANHKSTFPLCAPHFTKVTQTSKQQDKRSDEPSLRKDGVANASAKKLPVFGSEMLGAAGEHDLQLDENSVISRDLWKTEDALFEADRLVGSQKTDENVDDDIGSPQWIGNVEEERSGLLVLEEVVQKARPKAALIRPLAEQGKWEVQPGVPEGVRLDNGSTNGEMPALVRDMLVNERQPNLPMSSENPERLPYVKRSLSKGNVLADNGGDVRSNDPKGPWKDVPFKTSLPATVEGTLPALPDLTKPIASEGRKSPPQEDGASQESIKAFEPPVASRSRRASRERSRSADDGLKILEGVSRSYGDAQELPRLPPVKLRSGDSKPTEAARDGFVWSNSKPPTEPGVSKTSGGSADAAFGLGSFLDIPVGQDVSSVARRLSGGSRPSVSHGIVEDVSERLTFATAGDGQSESLAEYPDEYWDSDTYDDDDDPGYHRQPIEDEEWFLAHEIEDPDERSSPGLESTRSPHGKDYGKYEDDDRSIMEEELYYSGEEYYRTQGGESRKVQSEIERSGENDMYNPVQGSRNGAVRTHAGASSRDTAEYDGQLLDVEELDIIRGQPVWQGFTSQESHPVEGEDTVMRERARDDVGSVRSGGVGISSEVAEFGSEVRESVVGGSSEGDAESLKDREMGGYGSAPGRESSKIGLHNNSLNDAGGSPDVIKATSGEKPDEVDHEMILRYYNEAWSHKKGNVEKQVSEQLYQQEKREVKGSNGRAETRFQGQQEIGGFGFGGFSFPSPSSAGEIAMMSRADSGKSLWSVREIVTPGRGDDGDDYSNGIVGPDDTLAVWKRKSNESSPIISPRNEIFRNLTLSTDSTVSARSTDGYGSGEVKEGDEEDDTQVTDITKEEADAVAADDEEAAAVQEQIRRIRAEEEEFETFNLKIVHRKNRTGFEEDKDFPVVINSVIAGRYHVTEYLGSAAFSKAIQAHDLHTGMDVCMKIIKNNKDFFDQSLDEIKLLKYINRHDPGDKFHVLRLYDYFYHREHLFIVCELLRANLYEFHKYNRESGGEVYFTMPRLQSITRQCLEALEFIHGLKLIHCDLKPENILVKSYSRCEVKVIDLGSSCFQTDHLCSYVQSRSYRAPEVILGLPYNQKIDIWSLGCILAELCSGNVLFQNDSLPTLLARVVGILGPIDPDMLAKGRDSHKFFTKGHTLYERNQDTEQLEYLVPKKTSLSHRLPMGDQGFVDFVGFLLQSNPVCRPTAAEALKHSWLSYPYEPISA